MHQKVTKNNRGSDNSKQIFHRNIALLALNGVSAKVVSCICSKSFHTSLMLKTRNKYAGCVHETMEPESAKVIVSSTFPKEEKSIFYFLVQTLVLAGGMNDPYTMSYHVRIEPTKPTDCFQTIFPNSWLSRTKKTSEVNVTSAI